jgi:hypothetical protein
MKRNLTLFILLMLAFSFRPKAQSFYDLNTIQTIEITFAQSNWDYMLDTAAAGSGGFIMASSIKLNGTVFDSVGVKYKGNSSYNANQVKNPFHIELDTYKDQNYQGYTDVKLGNGFKDPSFLREVLSYKIVRNYMPAPLSNYANVYVNNQLLGLYANSESIGKRYADANFGSKDNAFFKCNPINGAGPGSSLFPNLVYLGSDSSSYYPRYEMQSDYGWKDLINLCDTLANHTTDLGKVLNINQALWMLAFDNVLVNLDSYIGAFAQNYYLYRDEYRRFRPVVWDLNESFGTFANTGSGNLNTTQAKQQMSPTLHSADANWPLIKKLLEIPVYKRMYIADMRTILDENIATSAYYNDGLALQNLIKNSVNADPNKFFSYANFLSNLTTDVNIGNGVASGLTNLMNGRNTYLSALPDFTAAAPVISGMTVSVTEPPIGSPVFITASVSGATSVNLYVQKEDYAPFAASAMLDDGQHGDGTAGDGIYGAAVTISGYTTRYYFYAENAQAGLFSPRRAEKEFYTLHSAIHANDGSVINEFLASNASIATDPNGQYDDWIELYNPTSKAVSFDSMYLTDSYGSLLKWKFPQGIALDPGGYLIVWADGDTLQPGLHASFKLSASGEQIALVHQTRGITDSIRFGVQTTDISMQRCYANGGVNWIAATPTYMTANTCPNGIQEYPADALQVYPNPFTGSFTVDSGTESLKRIRLINSLGQEVFRDDHPTPFRALVSPGSLPPGIYLLIINDKGSRRLVRSGN